MTANPLSAHPEQSSILSITGEIVGPQLRKPWKNAIAVGRAYELLRRDVLDHLRFLQHKIGYRGCRFHGLFHDEMTVVSRLPDGTLAFRWHQIDKIFDSLLELGLRPFVELNAMPVALASGTDTMFDWRMNITPPRDYSEWGQLVEAFARHVVDRYGLEEVSGWYFEVWNEPNLSGFWTGTKEEYWMLYKASAQALKKVSGRLRVGGPASSKASWIQDIIDYTSGQGVPLDFISTHLYPQDEYVTFPDREGSPHAPGDFFGETVREVQRTVLASRRPDLEIHWTEWNSLSAPSTAAISWVHNTTVDSIFGAALICKNCVELDAACDTFCWWVASDIFEECGLPHSEYSGTYGLMTINGIPKATFHAFEFLNRLRGERLATSSDIPLPPGCGWVATRETETIQILLWHQILPEFPNQTGWRGHLNLPALSESPVLIETRIGAGHGSAWETWKDLGSPQTLSKEEMRLLRAHAQPECMLHHVHNGTWGFSLSPGEVVLLELRPRGAAALPKSGLRRELLEWERKMGETSR